MNNQVKLIELLTEKMLAHRATKERCWNMGDKTNAHHQEGRELGLQTAIDILSELDTPPVPTIKPNWIKYDRNNPPNEGDYLVSDGTHWEKGTMITTQEPFWSVPELGLLYCGNDVKYYAHVGPVPTIKPGDKVRHEIHGYGTAHDSGSGNILVAFNTCQHALIVTAKDLEVVE